MRMLGNQKITFMSLIVSCLLVACADRDELKTTAGNESNKEVENLPDAAPEITSAVTQYAYTMLAPGNNNSTLIFARIVADSSTYKCPMLKGSDKSMVQTSVRPQTADGSQNPNFPIRICEAIVQAGVTYKTADSAVSLAAVNLNPQNVQVYGDSGCKTSVCTGTSPSAQFKSLADYGTKQPHDLILHMGDYNYRGTSAHFADKVVHDKKHKVYAYDAGDVPNPQPSCSYDDTYNSQNSTGSPKPDAWWYWKSDFFDAAKKLLPTAPWVFARGNHELCSRAGVGWFYFFGPGSRLTGSGVDQLFCPNQGKFDNPPADAANQIEMILPYALPLKSLQLWVMDSANACDANSGNVLTQQYQAQYNTLASTTSTTTPTWVMSHRPIWGHQGGGDINDMLQTALTASNNKEFPANVKLSLAGHMHIYEALTFFDDNGKATSRPSQIVIGNSGVSLGTAPGNGTDPDLDGQSAQYTSRAEYGYLQMALGSNDAWTGNVTASDGSIIVACDSSNPANGKVICY